MPSVTDRFNIRPPSRSSSEPWRCSRNAFQELHVELEPVPRLGLLVPLPPLPVRVMLPMRGQSTQAIGSLFVFLSPFQAVSLKRSRIYHPSLEISHAASPSLWFGRLQVSLRPTDA
jgi:hypothetical protein